MSAYAHHLVQDQHVWQKLEEELIHAGFRMPLFHRLPWVTQNPHRSYSLVSLQDKAGHPAAQVVLQSDTSRVLPGHHFLRVMRFGGNLTESTLDPMVEALRNIAAADSRALRLSVSVFSRDRRAEIAGSLQQHGFIKSATPQSYRHTLSLDVRPSVDDILLSLHKTARKGLKEAEKANLHTLVITDPVYADRIECLQREALARTGGEAEIFDYRRIIDLSRAHPELSRVVGLFPSATELDPDHLYGFAWGCMHGDHAEYHAAGTRRIPDRRISIGYPLLWSLITWTKEQGGDWFDLGGLTFNEGDDPLAGISDFKRYFSRVVEEVGEEWTLEPHPTKTRLAAAAGEGARRVSDFLAGFKKNRDKG